MISQIRSSFRLRLTLMVLLAIIIPLAGTLSFVALYGVQSIEADAKNALEAEADALSNAAVSWDDNARLAILNLSQQSTIKSMNAFSQRGALKSMADVYTDMYLIHTVDLSGDNVARSDFGSSSNYSDRDWFKGSMAGNDITLQTLIGRTTGEPSLAYSSPIRNNNGEIVGATLAVSTLDKLADSVGKIQIGDTGFGYLVDENGVVLAHPNPIYTSGELVDLSALPPVASVLAGKRGHFEYTDENSVDWFTHLEPLDNGWGIVIQQEKNEAMETLPQFLALSMIISIAVLMLIGILTWWVAGRAIRPISILTNAATAVAAGQLNETVKINQTDEIGTLSIAFNSMTLQLRDLVHNLENRVADRTRDLELANKIGRNVSEIHDANLILTAAVKTIQDEFDLYLTQIYLVQDDQETLLLSAAEGQAANRLLDQAHFLAINTTSINGTAVSEKRAIVVSNTTEDPRFRPNPLLPNTRSELAVPLLVADRAIGVLDIQSTIPNAFTEENVPAFTAMAGQLAIALENASLFSEREETSAELQTVLFDISLQAKGLAALNEMGTKLASATKLEDVYQIISDNILTLIKGDRASIALVTNDGNSAEVLALEGEKGALPTGTILPFTGTAVGLAIQENRIVQLPKESPMSTYGDSRQLAQQGIQSTLITPLSASGQVIGTLNIGSLEPYAFSETDVALMQQTATLLATTLDSMNLLERVQNLASIVEGHPNFIGIGSLDGDAIYANPAGLALMGLPANYDITGMTVVDFYTEESAEQFMQEGLPAALETGFWTAKMNLRRADDTTVPVEQTIAINYDVAGNARSFSITMRDITERQAAEESRRRLTTQLEERLLQVNAMQRTMTHEGWSAFLTSDKRLVQGFKYNNEQINLISSRDLQQGNIPALTEINSADNLPLSKDSLAAPVQVRGETIGVIGVRNPDGTPLTDAQVAVLNAMSQQVAVALDRARLFEEMELAREQMNLLYTGSEQVIKATSLDDVLGAVVENTSLKKLEQINLMFFDTPWTSNPPKSLSVGAVWVRDGQKPKTLSDSAIELQQFPLFPYLNSEQPFVCEDIEKDERMNEDTRTFISTMLKVRSLLIFPLITGGQWIGILAAQASSPRTYSDEEIRQISSLVSQAATVSQTQRLFTVTQQRARREQLLREVTAKVYAAPDAETIMKTAVKEVNRIMGVDSFVYLDEQSPKQSPPDNGHRPEIEETAEQEG